MRSRADVRRSLIALAAAVLLVFHSVIASAALGTLAVGSTSEGVTTIVCTASGPRVIMLDSSHAPDSPEKSPHTGALPHCCTAGCAIAGGAGLPVLYLLAWFLPPAPEPAATPAFEPPSFTSVLARSPGRPRAPPLPLA